MDTSRALVVGIFDAICIACALYGVHGEVHHGRNRGDTDGENVGGEVGGDLKRVHLGKDVAGFAGEVEGGWIEPENGR